MSKEIEALWADCRAKREAIRAELDEIISLINSKIETEKENGEPNNLARSSLAIDLIGGSIGSDRGNPTDIQ